MTQSSSLRSLEHHEAFVERHIGPNADEIAQMLRVVGHESLDAMTDAIVPGSIRSGAALDLPPPMTEVDRWRRSAPSPTATRLRSFIGQGYYGTHVPNVILRNISRTRPGTRLHALPARSRRAAWSAVNFQTMLADLTGMEIAKRAARRGHGRPRR